MLEGSKPVFPGGAPAWYPQFSNAVYTNLHAAATGSMTVDAAIARRSVTPRTGWPASGEFGATSGGRERLGPVGRLRRDRGPVGEGAPASSLLPYLLVAPVTIFIIGLALVPAVFTVVQSFFTVNRAGSRRSGSPGWTTSGGCSPTTRSSAASANTGLYVSSG